jgi:glycosyltransferase involved in cell wall biosynthesis
MFLPVSRAVAAGNRLVGSRLPFEVMPNFVRDDIEASPGGSESYTSRLPLGEYLLFAGDLSRFKGMDVLLRAYADLGDAPPLVLIGRRCLDTPTRLPRNVVALGSWPHAAVMEAWRGSMLGLLPSVGPEAFGIVALEAMASGRPVIASRIGGLPDVVVDGETGFIVPPGDADALRKAIKRLVDDSHLRARMGEAAKRRAGEFRASAVVPRIEAVYRRVLHDGAGRRPQVARTRPASA